MEGISTYKKEELLEACQDLRLPVSGNESIETLEIFIQAAYDDFENKKKVAVQKADPVEEEIDYGSIGDKSWRLQYILNKILFFL